MFTEKFNNNDNPETKDFEENQLNKESLSENASESLKNELFLENELDKTFDIDNPVDKKNTDDDFRPLENKDTSEKKLEDYSYEELRGMDPDKLIALNEDYRERYEAELRGMSQEEYQDYKYQMEASQYQDKADNQGSSKKFEDIEKEGKIESQFNDIEQRVKEFNQEYMGGFSSASDEKKALGANMNTIHDINKLQSAVMYEKESAWNRMTELKSDNPYYNNTNNAEYKEAAEKYKVMESMEKNLDLWKVELDGKNYAMSEDLELPYYQQTEHYHETRDQRLDKMEEYFNGADGKKAEGISSKLENGETEPFDKFQFEFQKDRMQSALDDIKENGTPEQKARAERLSEQLSNANRDFKEVHNEYKLNKDGTTTKNVDTYHSAKTIELENRETTLKNGGTKNTHAELNFGGKHVTEKSENFLYTGESTGKSSKQVTHEGINLKTTTKETGIDKNGEIYKKESTAQATVMKAEYGYSRDDSKMKYEVKAEASLINASISRETETESGTKTAFKAETNVGHIKTSASADMKNGEYKANAEATQVDAKASILLKDREGNSQELGIEGKYGSITGSASLNKYGPDVKVKTAEVSATPIIKVNGVDVLPKEIKPDVKGEKNIYKYQPMKEVKDALSGFDKAEKLKKSYSEKNSDKKEVFDKSETSFVKNVPEEKDKTAGKLVEDYSQAQEKTDMKNTPLDLETIKSLSEKNTVIPKMKEISDAYPATNEEPKSKISLFKESVKNNTHLNDVKKHLSDNSTEHPVPVIEKYKDAKDGKSSHGGRYAIGLESNYTIEENGRTYNIKNKTTANISLESSADDKNVKGNAAMSVDTVREIKSDKISEKTEVGINLIHSYADIETNKEDGRFSAKAGYNLGDSYFRKTVTDDVHESTFENKTELMGGNLEIEHNKYENKVSSEKFNFKNTSSVSFDGEEVASKSFYDSNAEIYSFSDNPFADAYKSEKIVEAYMEAEEKNFKSKEDDVTPEKENHKTLRETIEEILNK